MLRLIILMLLGIFLIGCDDDIAASQIPSVVENTFKSHFPDATDVEWETHGDDFEVDFEVDRTDHSARIDNAGTLLGYKYEITRNTIPSTIIAVLSGEYPNENWEDPEILVIGQNNYYQLEIDGFFNDKKIMLDNTGNKIDTIKFWN